MAHIKFKEKFWKNIYWEPYMCHCSSNWEYNRIGHQTTNIQFANGKREFWSWEAGEVILKPGTQGAGKIGGPWPTTGHWTLERWKRGEPASRRDARTKAWSWEKFSWFSHLTSQQPPHWPFTSCQGCHSNPTQPVHCVTGWGGEKLEGRGKDAPATAGDFFQGQASSLAKMHTT